MSVERFRQRVSDAPIWTREQIEEKLALAEGAIKLTKSEEVRASAIDLMGLLLSHERLRRDLEMWQFVHPNMPAPPEVMRY
jgi:hypothetical protein